MCLVDRANGAPYMLASAYWPSPYQRTVWEYNIRLAIEAAEEMGFNEINFDYIRFPDMIDLDMDNIDFRNDYDETMAQAINRFLFYARDELHERHVYLSCDVFGETSNDYVCAYGQYWPMMSNIADVMCAMPYPDHFAIHDYGIEQAVWEVPYQLLYNWGPYVMDRQEETPSPAKVAHGSRAYDTTGRSRRSNTTSTRSMNRSKVFMPTVWTTATWYGTHRVSFTATGHTHRRSMNEKTDQQQIRLKIGCRENGGLFLP